MTSAEVPTPLGPIEYIIVGFSGNTFSNAIADALGDLIDQNLVRIIDLAVVSKASDGTVAILESQELSPEVADALVKLNGSVRGLLSEADLMEVAATLEPGNTAAAILFEHLWATRFAAALRAANGSLLLSERIPADVVAEARATLLAAAAE